MIKLIEVPDEEYDEYSSPEDITMKEKLKDTDDGTPLMKKYDNSNPPDGWFRRYWENDQLRYEWEYKDGQRADGISKGWYPNGEKKSEWTYKNGKENGLRTEWYENGQKRVEVPYKNGKPNELYTKWYINGQKMEEITFKHGKFDGRYIEWYTNGQKIIRFFKDGIQKHGKIMDRRRKLELSKILKDGILND